MRRQPSLKRNRRITIIAATTAFACLGVVSALHSQTPQTPPAQAADNSGQSPAPQPQADAVGKLSFDVASVKQNTSNDRAYVSLSPGPESAPVNGGLYSATNFGLGFYLSFAYKLNIVQSRALGAELPKWANEERFDIQARAPANTTRAQMRLMMQALLADRFNLKAHFETRQTRVYALVFVKPGTTGPKLQPHSNDPPCPDPTAPSAAQDTFASLPSGVPVACDSPRGMAGPSGISYSGRHVTMKALAENLAMTPDASIDRPVIDQTGLVGDFDFALNFSYQAASIQGPTPGDQQAAFLEALKDQLGLKLEPTTGPANIFLIDHVEQPSAN